MAQLPHFSPDLDVEPLPAAVAALRTALGGCAALVIATPDAALLAALGRGLTQLVELAAAATAAPAQ